MNTHFEQGYCAGLVNERDNPYWMNTLAFYFWHAGNQVGLTVHCAVVEAVYLNSEHD